MIKKTYISERAKLETNIRIGVNTIILGASKIGRDSILDNDVIIGYPMKKTLLKLLEEKDDDYLSVLDNLSSGATIGAKAIIRSGTIIYETVIADEGLETGHHVLIRENTVIGKNVKIGTCSVIDGRTKIGDRVNIQSNVYIPLLTIIDDDAFLGPNVVILNDKYPPSKKLVGVYIGKNAVIGGGAILLPGIKIGENAVIGAGAIVTKDVPPNKVVVGAPARVITTRKEFDLKKQVYEKSD